MAQQNPEQPQSDGAGIPYQNAAEYLLNLPPLMTDGGRPNAEHYRVRIQRINLEMESRAIDGKPVTNLKALIDNIKDEAKVAGLNPDALMSSRPESAVIIDAVSSLLDEGGEALMEMCDETIAAIERGMDMADIECDKEIERRLLVAYEQGTGEISVDDLRRRRYVGKEWRALLTRLKLVRERARNPRACNPNNSIKVRPESLEAAHLVRYGVYVDRTNMAVDRECDAIIDVHEAMCRCAVAFWEAENDIWFHAEGIQYDAFPYEGIIIIMPPGHGKSTIGQWWLSRRIKRNPETQAIVLHAARAMAWEINKYVRATLDINEPIGRRAATIFPSPPVIEASAERTRIQTVKNIKAPTIRAAGVLERRSGANADVLFVDDPNDQEVRTDESKRLKTYDRLVGTWKRRLRGSNTFYVTISTLWHKGDSTCRQIELARKGDLNVKVINIKCGGPDSDPPFRPIWPKVYPADRLKQIYLGELNDSEYAAYYMGDPTETGDKTVKKIAYYDPDDDAHRSFVMACTQAISIDPSGQNKRTSDKAGFVRVGIGPVSEKSADGQTVSTWMELRILDAQQKRMNQTEMVAFAGEIADRFGIEDVHVETKSGYIATAEMFKNQYGITTINHEPIKSKLTRLEQASPAIEASGGRNPPVRFPGRRDPDTGIVGPDPKWQWLYEQILDAGFISEDGVLDAVSQVVRWYAPKLGIGREARRRSMIENLTKKMTPAEHRLDTYWKRRMGKIRVDDHHSAESMVMAGNSTV